MLEKTPGHRGRVWRGAVISCAAAAWLIGAVAPAAADSPPRPKGSVGGVIAAADAKALSDWALARPEVALRFKGARTRVIRAGYASAGKDGKAAIGAPIILAIRDYGAGVVRFVTVDLANGGVAVEETAGLVQPSLEELSEGKAIVMGDPKLAAFSADPALILQGGFHVKSPYGDDPCSREVCLEFAFMQREREPKPLAPEQMRPPRRVIVNLSQGAVVNRDYRANAEAGAPLPRMTAVEGSR